MKTTKWLTLALGALVLTSCETPPPVGGAASVRSSASELGRYNNSATPGSPAYASGMPYDPDQPAPSGRYMYQQNLLVYRSRQTHAAPRHLRPL